jgi:hypothetical protein
MYSMSGWRGFEGRQTATQLRRVMRDWPVRAQSARICNHEAPTVEAHPPYRGIKANIKAYSMPGVGSSSRLQAPEAAS